MSKLGKYEIIEEVGRGGFAVVYKARDPDLDRLVALKVLAPHLTWEREFAARFQNEAKSAARLRHPNVVTIYETGEEDGQLYIAMEYLEGRTLAQVIEDEGALPLERVLAILGQVADALDYAHKQGVLHRDVKPANIMVEEGGRAKPRATLMDFGLVKAMESSKSLTSQGTLLGSPEYMAPEQADPDRKDEIGPATDLYALGVVAYQMLTGRVPFPGNTPSTLVAHMQKAPPDPRSVCANLSAGVCRALLKALSKSPRGRYSTAMAMVDALRRTGVREARRPMPPALLWGLVAVLALIVCALISSLGGVWLSKLGSNVGTSTPTSISTYTPKLTPTATAASTATSTPTGTPTATATATIAPSPTPTPSAGARRVWEKDGAVMVYVPAGEFGMGSTDEDIEAVVAECSYCEREWFTREQPRHRVYVDAFWIDKTEVTNAQFAAFLTDQGNQPEGGVTWLNLQSG
ncbi:MAG: bifunctional serine/threonine-protein kinase/formylglycine-generating enzyme family protein [Planctomycetota bacterium]|jgi:serine/threonine-protein kinase